VLNDGYKLWGPKLFTPCSCLNEQSDDANTLIPVCAICDLRHSLHVCLRTEGVFCRGGPYSENPRYPQTHAAANHPQLPLTACSPFMAELPRQGQGRLSHRRMA